MNRTSPRARLRGDARAIRRLSHHRLLFHSSVQLERSSRPSSAEPHPPYSPLTPYPTERPPPLIALQSFDGQTSASQDRFSEAHGAHRSFPPPGSLPHARRRRSERRCWRSFTAHAQGPAHFLPPAIVHTSQPQHQPLALGKLAIQSPTAPPPQPRISTRIAILHGCNFLTKATSLAARSAPPPHTSRKISDPPRAALTAEA